MIISWCKLESERPVHLVGKSRLGSNRLMMIGDFSQAVGTPVKDERDTVRCRNNVVNFLPNLYIRHLIARPFTLCCCHCNADGNIVNRVIKALDCIRYVTSVFFR